MSCYIEHSGDFFSVRNLKKHQFQVAAQWHLETCECLWWLILIVPLIVTFGGASLWGVVEIWKEGPTFRKWVSRDMPLWAGANAGHSWNCPSLLSVSCCDLASPLELTEMPRRSQHYLFSLLGIHVGRMSQLCQIRPTQCTCKLSDHPHTSMATSFS